MAQKFDFIKTPHLPDKLDTHKQMELIRCATDPIYFMETYVKVQHPVKGNVPFELYEYQKEMVDVFYNYRNSVLLAARQLGKTTVVSAYLLWYTMFHDDKTVLIAANVFVQAMEIMDRIRFAYEELPNWLKAGVTTYNKGSIYFDNGSRIISRATSPNAGRGLSISLLYLDEFAAISPRIAQDFWTSIQPTLATGGSCIITSTPNSDEDQFAQIYHAACDTLDEHGFERPGGVGRNGFKSIKVTWDQHPDRDEEWARDQEAKIGNERFRREMNCEFIQEDETLINAMTLASLEGRDPIYKIGQIRWYGEVKANHTYIAALDPSMGTGNDYSAIQVFELPTMVQIAEWKHNQTGIKGQIAVLRTILKYLDQELRDKATMEPEIYWTIENNSVGEAALIVIDDTGEENFPGYFVHEPRKSAGVRTGRRRKGLNTNTRSKATAHARMKSLIESNRMTINSKALVSELKTYVASGSSFKAKYGSNDDLVSSTMLCVRLMQILSQMDPEFNEKLKESIDDSDSEDADPMPMAFL